MPRTFSLARLMLGITAFCLFCGLAVRFPIYALGLLAIVFFLTPSFVVWLILIRYSPYKVGLGVACTIGSICGLAVELPIAGEIAMDVGIQSSQVAVVAGLVVLAIIPAVGALALSGVLLAMITTFNDTKRVVTDRLRVTSIHNPKSRIQNSNCPNPGGPALGSHPNCRPTQPTPRDQHHPPPTKST